VSDSWAEMLAECVLPQGRRFQCTRKDERSSERIVCMPGVPDIANSMEAHAGLGQL
jgi:hypothetical protein